MTARREYDIDSRDSIAYASIPDKDRFIAVVAAHVYDREKQKEFLKKYDQIDELSLGRYIASKSGFPLDLTEEEKAAAQEAGTLYATLLAEVRSM